MQNKDKPCYPIRIKPTMEAIQKAAEDGRNLEPGNVVYTGLSKREHFAGLAMQGLSANPSLNECEYSRIAKWAVDQADELLKYLDEINTEQSEIRASGTGSPPDTFKPSTS